eukprot:1819805-Amphidinium_carterae.1
MSLLLLVTMQSAFLSGGISTSGDLCGCMACALGLLNKRQAIDPSLEKVQVVLFKHKVASRNPVGCDGELILSLESFFRAYSTLRPLVKETPVSTAKRNKEPNHLVQVRESASGNDRLRVSQGSQILLPRVIEFCFQVSMACCSLAY